MAFAQSDIDALKRALATGAMQVRYADGRSVTYRSVAEIREILSVAEAEANGAGVKRQNTVASF